MNQREVIVELGAELGSIALYGIRAEGGWSFTMEVIDQSAELIDEDCIQEKSAAVETWESALNLMDKSPWFKLSPISIHPEFRQQIWLAVQKRVRNDTDTSAVQMDRWRDLCCQPTRRTGTSKLTENGLYIEGLQGNFSKYRSSRFAGQDDLFEPRPDGAAIVFRRGHVANNLLIPPCRPEDREKIIRKIPPAHRHKHFGSMRSSQALAQSVFGTIDVLGRLPLLSGVKSEDGQPAFDSMLGHTRLEFEKAIRGLREPRPTSVDVWFEGPYRVAVECKLTESDFGACSRPDLKPTHENFEKQHCDGTYTQQRGRIARCALTEIKVRYWDHMAKVFGWSADVDHRPCPLHKTYQLSRNVLAACIDDDGKLHIDRGHALILYDQRNPSMAMEGACGRSWRAVCDALKFPSMLRRISWQDFIAQWPSDTILDWLKDELDKKYGLISSNARS
jgi:hypothetical protein